MTNQTKWSFLIMDFIDVPFLSDSEFFEEISSQEAEKISGGVQVGIDNSGVIVQGPGEDSIVGIGSV